MKSSTYLRWITAWWITAAAILAFGVFAKAQQPNGTINAPIYATGYISQVGGTNVTTTIKSQPNHPTNLNIYTTGTISGTWTIKLPNPAFEGQMLSFNCGAAANAISVTSSDGSSIDSTIPSTCSINSGFTIQFDQRSNIWRNIGSNNTSTFKPFTGVASQWPWQLNADGTWTLKKPTYSDIDGATAATINFTGLSSPYMSAPLSVWNDCNGLTMPTGSNCGQRIWVGNNPTPTNGGAGGDAVASLISIINGHNRGALFGQNIIVGQSAAISGALDGNQTGLEIDVFSDTGYTASNQPFYSSTATAGQHKNGLEVYSFPTIDLTAALSVYAQNPGQGWWSEGLSLSRVTNNGIHFYVNPDQSVTDTKAAFTNAAIFDQSNSVNVLRVSGSHAGAVIDLEDNPTLGYFVKAASGAASTIRFGNSANHNMSLSIDSGGTTAQSSALIFADRNTAKWTLSSNNTATFSIYNNGRGSSDVSLDNTTGAMTLAAAPILSAVGGYLYADPTTHVVSAATTIPLSKLAAQAANTVAANATSGSAAPSAYAMPSCSTAASAINWTTDSGFGCNTAVNAATLNGATFAAPGTIGGTTPGAGTFSSLVSQAGLVISNFNTIVNSQNTGDISIAGGNAYNQGGWIALRGPSAAAPNTILMGFSGGQSLLLNTTGLYIGASGSAAYPLDVYGAANATSYLVGGVAGVTCSGAPTASFASTNGIVTHC